MWLFTTVGFFSVVQKPRSPALTVRARIRADLDRLRAEYLPELGETKVTPGHDYPYRARVSHAAFAGALGRLVTDLHYGNFKDAVALKQGAARSSAYHDVWSVLRERLTSLDTAKASPAPATTPGSRKPPAYGGVIFSDDGRLLLREPRNRYGQYAWTFAKGRKEPGETPEETARREVEQETGLRATILARIPGLFEGDTSHTGFFLMTAKPGGERLGKETQAVRWVTPDEARKLIAETPSRLGRKRDLAVLAAALAMAKVRR